MAFTTRQETMALGDPSAVILDLAFCPDGACLAAASGELSIINNFGQPGGKSEIHIWDIGR